MIAAISLAEFTWKGFVASLLPRPWVVYRIGLLNLSHSNVKSKNAEHNLNADNIKEVTNAVRAAGVSPVLFYIYSDNEGSGGNIAGGFINHWTPKNVDTTDMSTSSAIQDANYLVKQSKKTNSSPAAGGVELKTCRPQLLSPY
ncbi:hypothetical protein [Gorillibacterium massiliense]|uniref:hypothetical protein n=1 Tax=Gorillibacterium massiliense TaxID=1280390 RepID=UPI000592CEE1|nr:hypothetical protein [Gorillibacterium massiliense]